MVPPAPSGRPLGARDHRQRDAVLDRPARVLAFELGEQPARPVSNFLSSTTGVCPIEIEHRGERFLQTVHVDELRAVEPLAFV
jgi:hypothetical protein